MSVYDDAPLDELIKFYAAVVLDPMLDAARFQFHELICKRLDVPEETVLFEDTDDPMTTKEAERIIRQKIKGLKQKCR